MPGNPGSNLGHLQISVTPVSYLSVWCVNRTAQQPRAGDAAGAARHPWRFPYPSGADIGTDLYACQRRT